MFQMIQELCEKIAQIFIDSNATTAMTARALEELAFSGEYDMVAFKKMRTEGFIKKASKTQYYLDVKAWQNPAKTRLKTALKKTAIIFGIVIVLFGVLVVLSETGVI